MSNEAEKVIPLSDAPLSAKPKSTPEYTERSAPFAPNTPAPPVPDIETSADAKPADSVSADVASRTFFIFYPSGYNKQIGLRQNLRRRNMLVVASFNPSVQPNLIIGPEDQKI